jgi:hypothetical protein
LGELKPEIARQPVDDLRAPTLFALSLENLAADLPVQQDPFAVHG